MAVRSSCSFILGLAVCCGTVPCAAADDQSSSFAQDARDLLQETPARLQGLLLGNLLMAKRKRPDWIRELSHEDIDPESVPGADDIQLVLQQERRDGPDLLTVRYPIMARGSLRTYAGAGLNQAVYHVESLAKPTLISRSSRHRSLGGAAELGAELRVSEQVNLTADVRWIELDSDASLLRSEHGLVSPDPIAVGVSLGWRFR